MARAKDCQTEWSKSEKNKYSTLMHRCGISGTGGLICKAEIETQTERKDI